MRVAFGREPKKTSEKAKLFELVSKTSKNAVFLIGADDGNRTRDLRLTNLKIFIPKLVLYADKSLINTSKSASIFYNRCKKILKLVHLHTPTNIFLIKSSDLKLPNTI